jgi:hypothetical protein
MPKIAVYQFSCRDQRTGENVENPQFATLKAIRLARSFPVSGTKVAANSFQFRDQ